jgi:hypothetical protein
MDAGSLDFDSEKCTGATGASMNIKNEADGSCKVEKFTSKSILNERLFSEKSNPAKNNGRAILTQREAQDIFKSRPSYSSKEPSKAGILAHFYGVSVKSVRDIWIGRTWYRSTYHLDSSKPVAKERLEKKPGRPRGAKDSKPRTRKPIKNLSDDEAKDKPYETNESIEQVFGMPVQQQQTIPLLKRGILCSIERTEPKYPIIGPNYFDHTSAARKAAQPKDLKVFQCPSIHALFSAAANSSTFIDPFHDDWAFWHVDAEAEKHALRQTEGTAARSPP